MTADVAQRVADACNHAIYQWLFKLVDRDARDFLDEGRVDFQLVQVLVTWLDQQDLAPSDFDAPNGPAALRALADVLAADRTLRTLLTLKIGGLGALAPEWQEVVFAARHLLQTQARRYEVER